MKRTLILAGVLAASLAANAQVQRTVLVEEWSNASCGPCAAQNPAFWSLLDANPTKVIPLNWRWYFPGFDPMNVQNPTEPNTRFVTYYGQSGVPTAMMDGVLIVDDCSYYTGSPHCLDQSEIDAQYAVTSPFAITLNPTLTPGMDSVTVTVDVNTPAAFTGSTLKLHVALIEKNIDFTSAPGSNGETHFDNVMRKTFPGVNGYDIQSGWALGETQSYTFTIPMPSYIYKTSELAVVAFIQNNSTKMVYQAEQSDMMPVVSVYGTTTPVAGINGLNCGTSLSGLTTTFTNIGSTTITQATVNYRVDGGTTMTVPYSGSLAAGANTTVNIPMISGLTSGAHTIETWVTDVNAISGIGMMGLNSKAFSISAGVGGATPLTEDFVSSSFPYAEWYLDNPDPSFTWARVSAHTGSMMFDNFSYAAGKLGNFIVEPVDLTTLTNPVMTFDVAYQQYDAENDRLQIYVSTNCGSTWSSPVFNEAGSTLATGNAASHTELTNPGASMWHPKSVDLSAYGSNSVVYIRFKATSAYGNNLFVDNINIASSTAGIENSGENVVNVYPNPTTDFVNITFNNNAQNVTVTLINSVGQTVKIFNNVNSNTMLSLEELASGVYILNADINGQRFTKQVIKN